MSNQFNPFRFGPNPCGFPCAPPFPAYPSCVIIDEQFDTNPSTRWTTLSGSYTWSGTTESITTTSDLRLRCDTVASRNLSTWYIKLVTGTGVGGVYRVYFADDSSMNGLWAEMDVGVSTTTLRIGNGVTTLKEYEDIPYIAEELYVCVTASVISVYVDDGTDRYHLAEVTTVTADDRFGIEVSSGSEVASVRFEESFSSENITCTKCTESCDFCIPGTETQLVLATLPTITADDCSDCSALSGLSVMLVQKPTPAGGVTGPDLFCTWEAEFSVTLGDCGVKNFTLTYYVAYFAGFGYGASLVLRNFDVEELDVIVQWLNTSGESRDCESTRTLAYSSSYGSQCDFSGSASIVPQT